MTAPRIMDEAGFWSDRLRAPMQRACQSLKLRHHFVRVENRAGDGDPDVYYRIGGVAGHIELKYSPAHPLRPTTQVLARGKGMRRSQIIWASREVWAGGVVWALVGTPMSTWLIDLRSRTPEFMDSIATMSFAQMSEVSAWHAHGNAFWPGLVALLALKDPPV